MNHFPLGNVAVEFSPNGRKMVTTRPFRWVDEDYGIDETVPEWTVSDGHSTPRPVWWLLSPTEYPASFLIHDHKFRNPGTWTRQNCDWAHYRLLRLSGCPKWKAEIVFQILSKASSGAWNRYREMETA